MEKVLVEVFISSGPCCNDVVDIIKPIINEFGDRIEYKLCTSIYQWDIVQKYGILNPPTIIINEKIQLNQIDKNSLTKAIQSQL